MAGSFQARIKSIVGAQTLHWRLNFLDLPHLLGIGMTVPGHQVGRLTVTIVRVVFRLWVEPE